MSFILLDGAKSIALYQSMFFIPHVLVLIAPIVTSLLPKPRRAKDSKDE